MTIIVVLLLLIRSHYDAWTHIAAILEKEIVMFKLPKTTSKQNHIIVLSMSVSARHRFWFYPSFGVVCDIHVDWPGTKWIKTTIYTISYILHIWKMNGLRFFFFYWIKYMNGDQFNALYTSVQFCMETRLGRRNKCKLCMANAYGIWVNNKSARIAHLKWIGNDRWQRHQ